MTGAVRVLVVFFFVAVVAYGAGFLAVLWGCRALYRWMVGS